MLTTLLGPMFRFEARISLLKKVADFTFAFLDTHFLMSPSSHRKAYALQVLSSVALGNEGDEALVKHGGVGVLVGALQHLCAIHVYIEPFDRGLVLRSVFTALAKLCGSKLARPVLSESRAWEPVCQLLKRSLSELETLEGWLALSGLIAAEWNPVEHAKQLQVLLELEPPSTVASVFLADISILLQSKSMDYCDTPLLRRLTGLLTAITEKETPSSTLVFIVSIALDMLSYRSNLDEQVMFDLVSILCTLSTHRKQKVRVHANNALEQFMLSFALSRVALGTSELMCLLRVVTLDRLDISRIGIPGMLLMRVLSSGALPRASSSPFFIQAYAACCIHENLILGYSAVLMLPEVLDMGRQIGRVCQVNSGDDLLDSPEYNPFLDYLYANLRETVIKRLANDPQDPTRFLHEAFNLAGLLT